MPAAIAIPLAIGAGTAAAGLGAAKIQSGASEDAANLTTQAANHAADVQAKSAADTLAFQQQQAAQARQDANTTAQANYGQWAAKEGRLSTLGQMVGAQPFQIPAYVPLNGMSGAPAAAPSPAAGNPNVTSMSAAMGQPAAAQGQSGTPAGMVTLRNQYGQMKQVPQQQASVYQGLGYQVVG